ncbi:helix-turn-helix domain-containing protein [Zoogloea sp. LCSB751]|uniref:helix-turn-helix domain-containing protein n=1 Tax=Zoogloea sp. LCSB751 TaxID=1965277 RepID=UPI0009A53163|nr:helix-turn-helix domain-containing protein [Zoogloea sp. LCSB751]
MRTVEVNDQGHRIGETHPQAKYSNGEVAAVLVLRDQGMTYQQIAKACEMPKSTVAHICRGDRRCQTTARYSTVER